MFGLGTYGKRRNRDRLRLSLKSLRRILQHELIRGAALCFVLSACGGGGTGPRSGFGGSAGSLSCQGYPKTVQVSVGGTPENYTQVCLIVQKTAPVTPSVSVSTVIGDMIGHGRDTLSAFAVNVRVVAQAANEGSATTLAQSVVISTANGNISASPAEVAYPQQLQIDFEIFTAPTTNLTLTDSVGDLAIDNYDATLQLTTQVGDVSLQTVQGQGQATVRTSTGDIAATLSGSAWTGAGMTATTQVGDISVSTPASYQAAFTATTDVGQVSVDGQQATSTKSSPATVTAGSGAPIVLETKTGDISVSATQ